MRVINVVLDTNIFISAIFWRGVPYQVVKSGFQGKYRLILSIGILEELIDKLINKFKLPKERVEREANLLLHFCYFVEPRLKVDVVKEDPSDNKVIECAIEGKAKYIVTGDPHLRRIKEYRGIKILSPKEFLARFNQLD